MVCFVSGGIRVRSRIALVAGCTIPSSQKVQGFQNVAVSKELGLDETFDLVDQPLDVLCIPKLNRSTTFLHFDTCSSVEI
jgi:hypothetical protein